MINSISSSAGSIGNYYQHIDSSNKIEVPVPSSLSVYAQFKYVRGVPASSNQEPVSLSRAQIIDNMVSYLNNNPEKINLGSDKEQNIVELEKEVHRVVNEEKISFNSLPGKSGNTGLIFNLTA